MDSTRLLPLLADLATFVCVVDAGNFSEAARQLNTTPSTVSRQIKRLEAALAARLLERSTREVRLTEVGRSVVTYSRTMLEAAIGAVDSASEASATPKGLVSLSAPRAYAYARIHPRLPKFLSRYPEVDIRVLYTDDSLDPFRDDVDVMIQVTHTPPESLSAKRVDDVKWHIFATPSYLKTRGMPLRPESLASHECLFNPGHTAHEQWTFQRGEERITLPVRGRYASNHAAARLDAALQGIGIAALPEFISDGPEHQGRLQKVLADWAFVPEAYAGPVWLLFPSNRHLPIRVRALIDYLAAELGAT
ncbi:LysR family transcriptional regulator [Pandoraea anhela]|uniref:LysR family transcriptional regulator n=1 Tax=Pandoraea anhela TaxID=2508295 RepID=A0A5E4WAY4_9BURK|nr:LysR family transcriptional regulator [Pandoraea anhela]VVE21748.1 LysR family transcriptional regulator [Pandoraea anhela]